MFRVQSVQLLCVQGSKCRTLSEVEVRVQGSLLHVQLFTYQMFACSNVRLYSCSKACLSEFTATFRHLNAANQKSEGIKAHETLIPINESNMPFGLFNRLYCSKTYFPLARWHCCYRGRVCIAKVGFR